MRTYIVYGYGFELPIDANLFVEFLKNHKDIFIKSNEEQELYDKFMALVNEIEEEFTKDKEIDPECELDFGFTDDEFADIFEDYCCDITGMYGYGAVISNIMNRETGIGFEYQSGDSDCDSDPAVLLSAKLPWNYNDVERKLTIESLVEIIKKYTKELFGYPHSGVGLEVEYYG
jgi:hypothetical protein